MTILGELLLPLKVDHVEYKISNVLKKWLKKAIELSHGHGYKRAMESLNLYHGLCIINLVPAPKKKIKILHFPY